MKKDELASVIKSNGIDKILPAGMIDRLELFSYAKGSVIIYAGEPSHYLSILVSGRCLVKPLGREGQETILTYLYAGDLIGDIELYAKKDYLHYVYADTDVELVRIPAELVDAQLASYVPFLHFVIDDTFKKLLNHSAYFSQIKLYGSKERLVQYILDACARLGALEIPFSVRDVAPFIGKSERQLRRLVKELAEEGLIEKGRKKLKIPDLSRLESYKN